jgi:two-component system, OmpR family, response regulator
MQDRRARLLVVTDDDLAREAMAITLRRVGFEVRCERDGRNLRIVNNEYDPSLVVLDTTFKQGGSGFEMALRLREDSAVPILFVSANDRVDERLSGFAVGGDDFLTRPFSMAEFVARVEAILRRYHHGLRERVLEFDDIELNKVGHSARRDGVLLDLTKVEFELLSTFLHNPGVVLSKTQLLREIWGSEHYNVNLVEVHLSALRRKLEAHGDRVIQTVRGVGYVMRSSRSEIAVAG